MFEGVGNMFNGMFGKIAPGLCRLTLNGGIAVKTSGGYKTYNVKKGTLTNVTGFCFEDFGDDLFYVLPTNKVDVGDIILVGGKPKCVISTDGKTIKAIDYEGSEVKEIIPERHVLMGATYFYGKIVSMFGNTNFLKSGKGVNKIMQIAMMRDMMGGNKSGDNSGMGGMMQMMMMSQMMGGDKENGFGNMFEGLFDGITGGDADEETEAEAKDEE